MPLRQDLARFHDLKRPAKERLANQIERLPMDRELREDMRLGVEQVSAIEAAKQARLLEAALDQIPGLLARLGRARSKTSAKVPGTS